MVEQVVAGLPPLWTRVEYTQDSEYDDREGSDVSAYGMHHAVTPSLQAILDLSKAGGRTVSMTLAVKDDERVLVVPFDKQPFTSASSYDNLSWTVEAANATLAPDYQLSDATYRSLAIIAAHAFVQEGVPLTHGVPGLYEHKNLNQWFGASYPTLCAGPYFDIQRVIREAKQLLTGTSPTQRKDDDMAEHIFNPGSNGGKGAVITYSNGRVQVHVNDTAWNQRNAALGAPPTLTPPRNASREIPNAYLQSFLHVEAGLPRDWDLNAHPVWIRDAEDVVIDEAKIASDTAAAVIAHLQAEGVEIDPAALDSIPQKTIDLLKERI